MFIRFSPTMWWEPFVLVLLLFMIIIIQQSECSIVANIHPIFTTLFDFENQLICISMMDAIEGGDFHI